MSVATLNRGNLPADLTSFVGRRAELADIRRLLGEHRIVTLTGMGGVGKTRLALRVAASAARAFADGAWLVELAALRDPGQIAHQIAAELGIHDAGDAHTLHHLVGYLSERRLLLVLDNCEHLVESCAAVVEPLLRRAVDVTVLATSRQPLGVEGERVVAVSPLTVPTEDRAVSPDSLGQYDSIVLLLDRARAVAPSFELTSENAPDVVRLLNRLDGIPLAVELAAAQLRILGPPQIVDRLDNGYHVLQSVSRTALPHRRSLKALIDWSFDLCTKQEQLLWARLSVFPRDFDVVAAEHVCVAGTDERWDVLQAIRGLVDKSILIADAATGTVRYRLPETLREYGAARLAETAEGGSILVQHCEYYGNLAKYAWREWFGPEQIRWTSWMNTEYVNLRAALETGLAHSTAAAAGLSVVPALAIHWLARGSLDEGRTLTERALAIESAPTRRRALLLALLAWLVSNQGDLDRTRALALEANELAEQTGESRTQGQSSLLLGLERVARSDFDAAQMYFERALTASSGQGQIAIAALRGLAAVAGATGDHELQEHYLRSGVAISHAAQESWERATTLWAWAKLEFDQGHFDRADVMARDALRLRAGFRDRIGLAQSFELLAWCAAEVGQFERSARLIAASDTLLHDLGATLYPDLVPRRAQCQAKLATALGEHAMAVATAIERLTLEDLIRYALGEQNSLPEPPPGRATDLTPRESEIAELVASGLSNREIAARMVISQRTAEGHVEHILSKLGFQSRAQIAAWVVEKRSGRQP